MKTLELKIPPALLMLVFMAAMWLIDYVLPMFKLNWDWREWVARVLFLAAITCIVSGIVSFKKARTTVNPTQPEKTTSVVTTGIYQLTRNPMYLGFFIMILALAIKLANPITWVLLPLFVIYMNQFQIKPEERALTEIFGNNYLQYQQSVRRWI